MVPTVPGTDREVPDADRYFDLSDPDSFLNQDCA